MSDSPTDDAARQQLAARLARGDQAAFAELYDACADGLHGYLTARVGSSDASDVLQSTFLRAVKSRRRFRGVENPVAYMYQIARNEASRATRRRPVERSLLSSEQVYAQPDVDDAETLAAAMRRLDGDDRELIELKIYGGLTFREIADVVARPQATVATRYRRALESLRAWLAKQYR